MAKQRLKLGLKAGFSSQLCHWQLGHISFPSAKFSHQYRRNLLSEYSVLVPQITWIKAYLSKSDIKVQSIILLFVFQAGCGSGQPGLVVGDPTHSGGVETRWSLWSFSTQAMLWFYYSMIFSLLNFQMLACCFKIKYVGIPIWLSNVWNDFAAGFAFSPSSCPHSCLCPKGSQAAKLHTEKTNFIIYFLKHTPFFTRATSQLVYSPPFPLLEVILHSLPPPTAKEVKLM